MTTLLLLILLIVTMLLWGFLLISFVPEKEAVAIRQRLERLRIRRAIRSEEAFSVQAQSITDRLGFYIYQLIWPVLSRLFPKGYLDWLQRLRTQSGQYDLTIGQLFTQKFGASVVFLIIGGGIAYMLGQPASAILKWAILGTLFGFFAVDFQMHSQASRRKTLIERQLPDFLDQLIVSVQAGLAPNAAIQFTTRRFRPGPLREEFEIALQEILLGAPRLEALARIAERTGQEDIRRLVLMLGFGERLGIPLSTTLTAVAEDLRNKRWEKAEKLANEAPVKIVFPTLLLVMPTIIIIIFAPMALNWFLGRTNQPGG